MDKDTGAGAGAAKAASGPGLIWLGGVAAGAAAGAVLWLFVLGPFQPPAESAAPDAQVSDAGGMTAAAPVTQDAGAAAASGPAPAAAPGADAPASAPPDAAAKSVADPPAAPAAEDPAVTAAPAAAPPAAPSFDTVRAEADGSVLIAGRAAAGSEVAIIADGAEVARATADSSGQFAAFLSLPPSAAARVLSLSTKATDGSGAASEASVILAPAAAVAVAAAEPAAPVTAPAPAAEAPPAAADATDAVPPAPAPAADAPAATADAEPPAAPGGAAAEALAEPAADGAAADAPAEQPAAAPARPGKADVLIADTKGVRKLAAGAAASVIIDTISYSADGDVQLAGRAPGAGAARIYLDNAAVADTVIDVRGAWSVTLPGIAPGRYTLRVDQIGADGKVTSRFETPFQREAPEVVAAAQAPQPAVAAQAPQPAAPAAVAATAPAADAAAGSSPAPSGEVPVAADQPSAAQTDQPAARPVAADAPPITTASVVTVQPGFTLWRIARENYGDGLLYVKVFEANKDQIRNPDLIYPGQLFAVPKAN